MAWTREQMAARAAKELGRFFSSPFVSQFTLMGGRTALEMRKTSMLAPVPVPKRPGL